MKKEIIIQDTQYTDPEQETQLEEFRKKLRAKVELEARQDGSQRKPQSPEEWQTVNINQVEIEVQGAINANQQRHLLASGVAVVRQIEQDADTKVFELQSSVHDMEHALPLAIEAADKLKPDMKKAAIRKWVAVGLAISSVAEGCLSYPALRHFSFTVAASIVGSAAVAIGVFISTYFFALHIKAAKDVSQWAARYLLCLVPAMFIFSTVGYMRANAYNHISTLKVDAGQIGNTSHPQASGFAIAILSIMLYGIGLAVAARFCETEADSLNEQAYKGKVKEVAVLQKSIKDKQDEIAKVEYDQQVQVVLAYKRYEYAYHQERQLVNFADHIGETYKQKNIRHRSDGTPSFFSQKPQFNFTLFFNSAKIQKS